MTFYRYTPTEIEQLMLDQVAGDFAVYAKDFEKADTAEALDYTCDVWQAVRKRQQGAA